ncbi:MAG: S8 family serine peptidase [Chloroflexi bacterium]|nr:S8 family serine peptidase [Chloroflexota bacterium]
MSRRNLLLGTIVIGALAIVLVASGAFGGPLSPQPDGSVAHAQTSDTPTPTPVPPPDQPGSEPPNDFDARNLTPVDDMPPVNERAAQTYPNLDSNLNRLVEQVTVGALSFAAAAEQAPLHSGESVAVTLFVESGSAEGIADWLEENGASPRNIGDDYIEAYVPVSLLGAASEQDGVGVIRTMIPPEALQGSIVSEGAALHGAPAWNAAGFTGVGVKIGIIDVGFEGFASLMGSEVPATVQTRCYHDLGMYTSDLSDCEYDSRHGTAVTEAVFDIAPDATYYISNPGSWSDLQSATQWMVANDVDVINHSVTWIWHGRGDGISPFASGPLTTVDIAVDGGIIWVNSAGNSATDTWYGTFNDPDGDNVHSFESGDECNNITLDPGDVILVQLRWGDIWMGASRDLDLTLNRVTSSGNFPVASSTDNQFGDIEHIPLELFVYASEEGGEYCLTVNQWGARRPEWLQMQAWRIRELEHHTNSYSITSPAESKNPGMLAVGATRYSDTSTIEFFSSQGPTPDGRIKPEIVGVDGGQTAAYRSGESPEGRFYGTSQAAPHIAGLAALVKQQNPDYTPAQIADYLKSNAEARGSVPNNTWGYGFAKLPSDVTSIIPTPTSTPTATPIPDDVCIAALTGPATIDGSWTADCLSSTAAPGGEGDRYARFYTFTLTGNTVVDVTLESEINTYLYIRSGHGPDGAIVEDGGSSTISELSQELAAGDYTIEATTYNPNEGGDFTLTVQMEGTVTPTPTPPATPTPIPTPTPPAPPAPDIKEAACNADDLSHIGDYETVVEYGPFTYRSNYYGIVQEYLIRLEATTSDVAIVCIATRYDIVDNARWHGLNYSTALSEFGTIVDGNINDHEQAFIANQIGHDMLGLHVDYLSSGEERKLTDARFIDARNLTVALVRFIHPGADEYPDIEGPAGVARTIANRLFSAVGANSWGRQAFDAAEALK